MNNDDEKPMLEKLGEVSFIAPAVERFFRVLQIGMSLFHKNKVDATRDGATESFRKTVVRSRNTEYVIVAWIAIELLLYPLFIGLDMEGGMLAGTAAGLVFSWIVFLAAAFRIVNIVEISINKNIFDRLRIQSTHIMTSLVRTLVLTVVNYIELLFCFGLIYLTNFGKLHGAHEWYDCLYFSIMTQLTVGYGDIAPVGFAKFLACMQGLLGFMFSLFILGRYVAVLPKIETVIKDDKQIDVDEPSPPKR